MKSVRVVPTLRLSLLLVLLAVMLRAQPARQELFYSAEVKPDDAQRIHFVLEVRNPTKAELTFEFPYWAPGAYRALTISSYGGKEAVDSMEDFRAEDGAGKALALKRDSARVFTIARGDATTVRFAYACRVFAQGNNRSYLTANAGLIDGPRSWAWLHDAKASPVMVRFALPEGWQAACGLERTPHPLTFHADDFDRLVDAPVAIGLMERWVQLVRGVPHEIVALTGGGESTTDVPALQDMVRRIVECSAAMFGDIPYPHYTFLYTPGGGGLEHLSSTSIGTGNPRRITVKGVRGVTAHEYFHTYNVKRMRPFALGPFDYSAAVPVDDLWICEGLTNYYTNIVLWRSELYTDPEFAGVFRSAIGGYESNPAHLEQSPQASSRSVWTDETRISYYQQGEVLGLALDLLIRDGSDNRFGLEHAMRRMYRTYGGYYRHEAPQPGFASADFPRVIREVTGVNVDAFFASHIARAEEVDWNRYLNAAGMQLVLQESEISALAGLRRWPGEAGLPLAAGMPLARMGLRAGDKLLEIDGKDATNSRDALRTLAAAAVGARINVKIERDGQGKTLTLVIPAAASISQLLLKEIEGTVIISGVPAVPAFANSKLKGGETLLAVGRQAVTDRAQAAQLLAGLAPADIAQLKVRDSAGERSVMLKTEAARARRVQSLEFVEKPTPRQLAIRNGLKTGSQQPAPSK